MTKRFTVLASLLPLASVLAVASTGAANAGPSPLIVVVMENHAYSGVIGNKNMPYFNQLWAEGQGGTGPVTDYTQMYSVSHPSLPNYLAIASGSTQGKTNDTVAAGQFSVPSVWDQLTAAGVSWRIFEEGMPGVCSPAVTYNDTATDGQYALKHNPGTPFSPVYTSAECQNVQPLSGLNTAALPQVIFVTPNLCDDDHGIPSGSTDPFQNCVTGTSALAQRSDGWLQTHVNAWTAAGADVLITWDEGSGTAGVNGTAGGGQIASLLTGPGVNPGQDPTQYSHYSVLAGIEDLYGLPLLAGAATANPVSLPGATTTPPPTVTITQPADNSTVSGTLTVSGTASDSVGVTQVRVSVDSGTPQTATGATNWTTSIDTTALSNGPHTIYARATGADGKVGSASVTVDVNNPGTGTSCPATPPGTTELSGNVSLESGQNGWTGVYNGNSSVTRIVPPGGSYDGTWALQIGPKAGTSGAAGVNNARPNWVPGPPGTGTTAGATYTGSAFVQASVPGESVSLIVRETTLAGAGVGYQTTTVTLPDTAWHRVSSGYTAHNSGDMIRYSLYASNLASSSQYFLADCLSLQTPS